MHECLQNKINKWTWNTHLSWNMFLYVRRRHKDNSMVSYTVVLNALIPHFKIPLHLLCAIFIIFLILIGHYRCIITVITQYESWITFVMHYMYQITFWIFMYILWCLPSQEKSINTYVSKSAAASPKPHIVVDSPHSE